MHEPERELGAPFGRGEIMRLALAVTLHLQHIRPLLAIETVRERHRQLDKFVAHVGPDVAVRALRESHIVDWLSVQNVRASTLHQRFGTVRYFVYDCIRHGWMKSDPTIGIRLPRRPRLAPRALTLDELHAIGRVLPDERARLIIALSINEALRRVEICRVEMEDIDLRTMTLYVHTAKARSDDAVPLSEDTAVNFLEPYLRVRGRHAGPLIRSYVYPYGALNPGSVTSMVTRWFRDAGIKEAAYDGRSLHAGRHTKASVLLDAGASPEIVQKYLRHASMGTTFASYIRNRQRVDDLRPYSSFLPGDEAA